MKRFARLLVVSALACFGLALLVGSARAATTVQNQNSSSGGSAFSGNATATNTASLGVGPVASSDTGPAQASQIGNNNVSISQSSVAKSGDAVVGSQITGIVGGGNATVQNQNSSEGGEAFTGNAVAGNLIDGLSVGPAAFAGDANASASQLGDNNVDIAQAAEAITGDAVVNSQVTGIVGANDAVVQGQNSADGGDATSGNADALNEILGGSAGPVASSSTGTGLAAQDGDNGVGVAQDAVSHSGDGVAGSQVVGTVGDSFGFATVRESAAGF